jgi:hypothetical protein
MRRAVLLIVLLSALGFHQAGDADPERLAGFMTGAFSSKAQADADKEYFDVHLHMARAWKDRPGEYWLYVEQAMATALDKPYRQRVYKLEKRSDKVILSRVYDLPGDPLKFAGAWKKDEPLADIKPEQLTEKAGCAITLIRKADGTYSGATKGQGCVSNLKGASYATSEVTITADTLTSWDRGYDAANKQVWGAVKGPYVFMKSAK